MHGFKYQGKRSLFFLILILILRGESLFAVSLEIDTDHDGVIDTIDIDDDNDGILDINECNISSTILKTLVICDTDNDSIFNHLDLDSDNDGIPDNVEAQTSLEFKSSKGVVDEKGHDSFLYGSSGLKFIDSDGDNIPDTLDTDSDNDSLSDEEESGFILEHEVGINGLDNGAEREDSYKDSNGKTFNGKKLILKHSNLNDFEMDYRVPNSSDILVETDKLIKEDENSSDDILKISTINRQMFNFINEESSSVKKNKVVDSDKNFKDNDNDEVFFQVTRSVGSSIKEFVENNKSTFSYLNNNLNLSKVIIHSIKNDLTIQAIILEKSENINSSIEEEQYSVSYTLCKPLKSLNCAREKAIILMDVE